MVAGGDAAPRKRAKKAAGSDDAAAADGAAPGGSSGATPPPRKPPTGRRGGAAAGRGRSKADKVDDDLLNQLVEKEEGKGGATVCSGLYRSCTLSVNISKSNQYKSSATEPK